MSEPKNKPTQLGFSDLEWQKKVCVLEETVGALLPAPGAPHAATHSDGGADEIVVENLATASVTTTDVLRPDGSGGLVFGSIVPASHASTHEIGGTDLITVEDLVTLSGDTSLVLRPDGIGGSTFGAVPAHATNHSDGGSDEITVEDLATGSLNTLLVLQPDGAGGVTFGAVTAGAHAANHSDGGSDEITVEDLATASVTTTDVLKPDGSGGLAFGSPGGVSALTFGGGNITAAGTTDRFLAPWYDSGSAGNSEEFIQPWPFDCVIDQLRGVWGAASGSVNVDFVLRVEASDTSVTFTTLSDAGSGADLVNSVAVSAGDRVSFVVRKSGGTGTAMSALMISLRVSA